jgi:glycosyltransferase involved in cell wall biosynthesis
VKIAARIAESKKYEKVQGKKQLLIDLSVIAFHDAGTGIQRVTRAIFVALNGLPLAHYDIRPVAATRTIDYRYLPDDFEIGGAPPDLATCPRVEPGRGDIFLGLDLASMVMPRHERQLAQWRQTGTALHILLFDMLPLLHGRWFRRAARRNFRRWIGTLERQADSVICQCKTVADQFEHWNGRWWPPFGRRHVRAVSIPLSGDMDGSVPSRGLPANLDAIFDWMDRHDTVLMVGTVEPRKGYDQAIAGFKLFWRQGGRDTPQLLLVGRSGWKTGELQKELADLSSLTGPFLWLQNVSDEFLERIYQRAKLLLFASRGEGFGLPIAEAICRGLPVLFRDLPELQQFVGPGTSQFRADTPRELADAVSAWIDNPPPVREPHDHYRRSWDDVAIELANALQLGLASPDGLAVTLRG